MVAEAAPRSALDLRAELDRLERRLRRELDRLPGPLRRLEAELPAAFGKAGCGDRWVDRFAPLTLLYPLLHAEALAPAHLRAARSLTLPQSLLVLHAFLDDRRRDRQVAWTEAHREVEGGLVTTALLAVERALGDEWRTRAQELLRSSAGVEQAAPGRPPEGDDVAEGVVARHRCGFVVTRCLLEAAATPAQLAAADAGFRDLVVGLQWMDDLEDLEEDLATGAPNLLLAELRAARRHCRELASVLAELDRRRLLDAALGAAGARFEAALATFRGAGWHQLAARAGERSRRATALLGTLARARAAAGTPTQ